MKQLKVNGNSIIDWGGDNNQSLVFVHAFPMSQNMWEEQVKYFKDKYRVITFDNKGFGNSEKEDGNYTVDSYADDVLNIIEHLKLNMPIICGLSMGGYIALRILEKAQDKFKAAILCDTRAEADGNEAKLKRAEQIKQIKSGGREDFVKVFITNSISSKSLNAPGKAIYNKIYSIISEQSDRTICSGLMTLGMRTDTTGFLNKINLPVLIIVGDEDKLTPPENSHNMNSKIKDSLLVTMQGCGHFTNIEDTDKFNNTINQFLVKLS